MASHQGNFILFSSSKATSGFSLSSTPLFPPQPSAAPQQQSPSSVNTIYTRIFNLLNASVLSARAFSRTTTIKYQEWCAGALAHLLAFEATHSHAATAIEIAVWQCHRRNMAAAVEAAERELRGKREMLAGFLHWANGPQMGVHECCLWEYWWWVMGQQGQEMLPRDRGQRGQAELRHEEQEGEDGWAEISREIEQQRSAKQQEADQAWGSWVQNTGVASSAASSSASSTPSPSPAPLNHRTLLADLTRPDRDTITQKEAENTYDNLHHWFSTAGGEGLIELPEIYEIPLYDSPISDEQIERCYSGEYRDGMDSDVWVERRGRMRREKEVEEHRVEEEEEEEDEGVEDEEVEVEEMSGIEEQVIDEETGAQGEEPRDWSLQNILYLSIKALEELQG